MILDFHPSQPGNRRWANGRKFIGYWLDTKFAHRHYDNEEQLSLPNPRNFIDENWDKETRAEVARRLQLGSPFAQWMGYSYCRICDKGRLGTQCFTLDGSWVWPAGFYHYIEEHSVRPPDKFVVHILSIDHSFLEKMEQHSLAVKGIYSKWNKYSDGTGCPDKGTSCTFNDKEYPRCKKTLKSRKNARAISVSSSGRCQWADKRRHEESTQELERFNKDIDEFVLNEWREGML